jgi:hypothetical protein
MTATATWWHCGLCKFRMQDDGTSGSALRMEQHITTHLATSVATTTCPDCGTEILVWVLEDGLHAKHCKGRKAAHHAGAARKPPQAG